MDESDPASMISYAVIVPGSENEYVDNCNYTPAHMNFSSGTFNYGSWADAWFIKGCRPCILNYEGTVECYLDPTNYAYACTWNDDGTYARGGKAIINSSCVGNVMIEIPTVWIKVDTTISTQPKFYFANKQPIVDGSPDTTYHAYAHTDRKGDVAPYMYIGAYEAYSDNTGSRVTLRSRSGNDSTISASVDSIQNIWNSLDAARNNNMYEVSGTYVYYDSENAFKHRIWDLQGFSEAQLIRLLLILIGRSTDSSAIFGTGYRIQAEVISGNSYKYTCKSGTMDDKGLFWGSSEDNLGVKVFGIEHFWGAFNDAMIGLLFDVHSGWLYYKLTPGVWGYLNLGKAGTSPTTWMSARAYGYIDSSPPMEYYSAGVYVTGRFWIEKMRVGGFGLLPTLLPLSATESASSSTYYTDLVQLPNVPITNSGLHVVLGPGSIDRTEDRTEFSSLDNNGMFGLTIQSIYKNGIPAIPGFRLVCHPLASPFSE